MWQRGRKEGREDKGRRKEKKRRRKGGKVDKIKR